MARIERPALWRDGRLQARAKRGSDTLLGTAEARRRRLEQLGPVDKKQHASAGEDERQQGKAELGGLCGTMTRRLVHAAMDQRRSAGTSKQHDTKQSWWELTHETRCFSASDR
ncbi:MAG: hypothetical protein KAY22_24610 [Rhizorhabdus sp.]|uniref:hypothetical protein n=1 Tax=Rhizorhabdus sp. TaxID=1968843 RepID=UPI001B42B2D3|nr:hypothetical protein [Rhizorhabdus sp.]MBP8235484.1 hypothetical protein [Rhizorhabdus sp.]